MAFVTGRPSTPSPRTGGLVRAARPPRSARPSALRDHLKGPVKGTCLMPDGRGPAARGPKPEYPSDVPPLRRRVRAEPRQGDGSEHRVRRLGPLARAARAIPAPAAAPRAPVRHAANPRSDEPDAVVPHVRICGSPGLPRRLVDGLGRSLSDGRRWRGRGPRETEMPVAVVREGALAMGVDLEAGSWPVSRAKPAFTAAARAACTRAWTPRSTVIDSDAAPERPSAGRERWRFRRS